MKKISVEGFVSFLDSLKAEDFKSDAVDQFFTKNRLDMDDFHPYIFFREDEYGRNLVSQSEFYELLVLTWLPNQGTPIHDHDGQRCWMWIHTGSLSNRRYHLPKSDGGVLLPKGEVAILGAQDLLYMDDQCGTHSLYNAGSKPAVSLHLYAGHVSKCRTYNKDSNLFEWTTVENFTEYGKPVGLDDYASLPH